VRLQDCGERFAALQGVGIFWIGVELHAVTFENGSSAGNLPVVSYSLVNLRVAILLASDVRLVEGVDADDRTGDGCRDLPAEKTLRRWRRCSCTAIRTDGLACFLQHFDSGILRVIGRGLEPEIREDAIRTVIFRRGYGFRGLPG